MKGESELLIDGNILRELVTTKMPFGKCKDTLIYNLPEHYLEWFFQKGFPTGKIGMLLGTIYEIKLNGLGYLLKPFKTFEKK